ncbi:P-loop containing nucleoside triphosphate hydrolase protein [Choiromyces venosus 120613-1]|uniref:Origin recognition complex subunit 1 n=1 Tax=Choiromyces venosus 120613-1 TaxID=1336337 RepID=A0A3N4JQG7_9PEZI|nr:P-loop containing nucleoside triphosphate hydrolase protein [Choiromyces venosus 120613-1]
MAPSSMSPSPSLPSPSPPPPTKKKQPNLTRVRKILHSVQCEDSDDELGDEDLPWEWIHSGDPKVGDTKVGAKMGQFNIGIGDCVLIKGEGLQGEAYIGMICEFDEEERKLEDGGGVEMMVNVMSFSTEFEVKNREKKRVDYLPNELYLNPSYNLIPLPSINGRAKVLSLQKFNEAYPAGVQKKSKEYEKGEVWKGRETDITAIGEMVYHGTKVVKMRENKPAAAAGQRRAKRHKAGGSGDDGEWDRGLLDGDEIAELDDVLEDDPNFSHRTKAPCTTSKKRKSSSITTPTRRTPGGVSKKYTTPTYKRIVVKKPLLFTPLSTRTLSPGTHLSTPYALARHRLHVSTLPPSLPCREAQFSEVYSHLSAAIAEGTGSCIYISSTPGTGKTATIRELITQLQYLVALEELDDFTFVEINGMKVTDLHQAYSLLWEAIKGDRVSPSQALGLLESEFSTPSPRSVPCVVLMDELDELVTRGQGVMYNFFNWPGGWHSKLIVLAVANTMDLPERTLSNKISSRLGLTRITFPGYTHSQLMSIIQSRLEGVPGNIVDPDAVQFASRKVAAVSGDATRALDICRRAVEIVEYSSNKDTDNNQPPSSSSCRKSGAISPSNITGGGLKAGGRVTITVVKQAIQEATSSPLQMFLKTTSLVSKIFITALLLRSRHSGIGEGVLRDVLDEAERIVRAQGVAEEELGGGARVAGIKAAVRGLVEAGVVSVEKKGGGGGRVRFLIGEEEVKAALREDGDVGGVVGR